MEVPCELARIIISEDMDGQMIFLREKEGARAFPIIIGIYEAYAIHRKINNDATPRPLTHDLLASVISEMGGTLERIVVNELKNDTFYARLRVRQGEELLSIDARPSDAIALAVQLGAEIWVEDSVLDQAGIYQMPEEGSEDAPDDENSSLDDGGEA